MSWYEQPVNLSDEAAAVLAAGMREVALADGDMHQQELALIATFGGSDTGNVQDAPTVLTNSEVRAAYVRSLIMVALADGEISSSEQAKIRELAGAVGVGDSDVDAFVLDVKRFFLSAFSEVRVFRDAVVNIASDLGLPETEIEALGQS